MSAKRRIVIAFEKYVVNPLMKRLSGFVGPVLLETTGRRTGKKRRTPVGVRVEDGSYWIVTEHGRSSDYVRNIEADPRVRVKRHSRWRNGTADVLHDEDPSRRLGGMNGVIVRLLATDLLVIRIDLT